MRTTQHKLWKGHKEARIVSVADIVSGKWKTGKDKQYNYDACKDLNWIDYQLGAMSHSHDLCLQACDVVSKGAKSIVDKKMQDIQNRLRLLHTKLNNTKIQVKDPETDKTRTLSEKDFYERSNDLSGSLTGNFLTEYNWNQYEREKNKFHRNLWKQFNEEMINQYKEQYGEQIGKEKWKKFLQ